MRHSSVAIRKMVGCLAVAVSLALLPTDARADRDISLGKSCQSAIDGETALGSQFHESAPRKDEQSFVISFDGRSDGKPAWIVYFCVSGAVVSQVITITVSSESEGHLVFSDWKERLSAKLGAPGYDSDEVELAQASEAIGLSIRRNVAWTKDDRNTVVTFGASFDGSMSVSMMATGSEPAKEFMRNINGEPDYTTRMSTEPWCAERWLYKYPDDGKPGGPEGLFVGFTADGFLCYLFEHEEDVNQIDPPWLIEPVTMIYPIEAVVQDLEGSVIFSFTVARDGTVIETSIIESSDPLFASAVTDAFKSFAVDVSAFVGEEFPYTRKVKFPFVLEDYEPKAER